MIDGFNKIYEIGVGGFGKVFVGIFKDGRIMVIKCVLGFVISN